MLRPSAIIVRIAGMPCGGGGNLDEHVRSAMRWCRSRAAATVAVGVAGKFGGDLDGHEPVGSLTGIERRPQDRARVLDVGDDEVPIGVGHRAARGDERAELFVVVVGALDRPRKDGGVRGDAPDAVGGHAGERSVAEVRTGEVVEPRTLPVLVEELLQFRHRPGLLA